MFRENIKMAFQAITAYKMRSALSCLGIMIGVFSIIVILTAMNGMKSFVHDQFSSIGGGGVYVQKMPMIITSRADWEEYRKRRNLRISDYERIKEQSMIADFISPFYAVRRTIKYKHESIQRVRTVGTGYQYPLTDNLVIEYGRFFTEAEEQENSRVTVIGPDIAKELFPLEDPIGKRIKLNGEGFRVIGVVEARAEVFGNSQNDRIYIPYTTLKGRTSSRRGLSISVKITDSKQKEALNDELRGIMRMSRKIAPADEDDFAINDIDMLAEMFENITKTTYLVVFGISCISLFVGGIGIMNIMIVSVTERTKEIGLRKSLGAKQSSILSQFLGESVILSIIGGIPGILLGVVSAFFVLTLMNIPLTLSLSPFIIGFTFSVIIGTISGFLPAYKASKLVPVEALRFD